MNQEHNQSIIRQKIRKHRLDSIEKIKKKASKKDLNKPVAFWTKPDRLLNELEMN